MILTVASRHRSPAHAAVLSSVVRRPAILAFFCVLTELCFFLLLWPPAPKSPPGQFFVFVSCRVILHTHEFYLLWPPAPKLPFSPARPPLYAVRSAVVPTFFFSPFLTDAAATTSIRDEPQYDAAVLAFRARFVRFRHICQPLRFITR